MSAQSDSVKLAMNKPSLTDAEWESSVDNLNALNMVEMLTTLSSIRDAAKRQSLVEHAQTILGNNRGWKASWERINFAFSVVVNKAITFYPDDLEPGQADDARNFLTPSWPVNGSRAGSPAFDTLNQAAIHAITEINPRSIALDVEFSGSLFTRLGSYGFTAPVRGTVEKKDGKLLRSSSSDIPVPSGTKKVGMYHTHGAAIKNAGAEVFSADDVIIMSARQIYSFVGTPQGHIKCLIPKAEIPPAEQSFLPFKQVTIR